MPKHGRRTKPQDLCIITREDGEQGKPMAYTTSLDTMFSSERDPSNAFKDARSAAKPRQRNKTRNKKYYNFEVVKPGQVAQPHYEACGTEFGNWPLFPANLNDCAIVNLDKRKFFKEAKFTAPTYMTDTRCSCCTDWLRAANAKQRKSVKAEAEDWDKRWTRSDFAGALACDGRYYQELGYEDADYTLDDEWYRWDWDWGSILLDHTSPPSQYRGEWQDCDQPQAVYDLETLVNNAMAGLRAPILEPGWDDLVDDCWSSPEMDWVHEGRELFEDEEDFELV